MSAPAPSPTLTDRYIHAVVRTLPEQQRTDVAAELRAAIADQCDARLAAGESPAAAERAVLTDLGDPDALAAAYGDRPLHLVGPRYYLEWWRLLKLLLWIVVPLGTFGIALGQVLAGAPAGGVAGSAIGGALSIAVHVAFWTTLVFVVVERSDRARGKATRFGAWNVDHLPDVQQDGAAFRDVVAAIVCLVVVAAVVVWDQLVGAVYLDGRWMSFLSPALWPWIVGALLVIMAIEVAVQIIRYLQRRWTMPLAVINAVLDAVVAGGAVVLLSREALLNPEFWLAVIPRGGETVFGVVSILAGFLIVGTAAWDAVDAFRKARRSR